MEFTLERKADRRYHFCNAVITRPSVRQRSGGAPKALVPETLKSNFPELNSETCNEFALPRRVGKWYLFLKIFKFFVRKMKP